MTEAPDTVPLPEKDTSSATWKFEFEDTVNADPLAKGICLKVLRVFLNFASKSDPRAFCSLPDLMRLTASTRPTVKKALKVMVRLGYFEALYVTDGGSTMYKLVNARKEQIDTHLEISRVSLAAERADRKKRERKSRRGKETCPPSDVQVERNFPPKVKETFPNTVEGYRRGSINEDGREGLVRDTPLNDNLYATTSGDDPTVPFDVPRDQHEADEILSQVGDVHPVILNSLRRMLMAGKLTPALLLSDMGGGNAGT